MTKPTNEEMEEAIAQSVALGVPPLALGLLLAGYRAHAHPVYSIPTGGKPRRAGLPGDPRTHNADGTWKAGVDRMAILGPRAQTNQASA